MQDFAVARMKYILMLLLLGAVVEDACAQVSTEDDVSCGNYAACPSNWSCEKVLQNTCRTSLVCVPTCVTDVNADANLQECVDTRKKACEICEDVTKEQCLVIPSTDCQTVTEEQCKTADGEICIKGPPPDCTAVINRTCIMVPAKTCKLPKSRRRKCVDTIEESCTTLTEPICREVEVPDCSEEVCRMVRKIDENCEIKEGKSKCQPTLVRECEIVEGTTCKGLKKVTKCSEAIVKRCEQVTVPCGNSAALADCKLEEESCTEEDVETCDDEYESKCGADATDCKVKRVKRCKTVKEKSCSDFVVRKCDSNLDNCDVPECEGPTPVECGESTCAVGEQCSSICTRMVISDHPEECEIQETEGCIRQSR